MVQATILVKMALFRTGFKHSRDQNGPKMVHFGPFWPEEVYFGPSRSANRTQSLWPFLNKECPHKERNRGKQFETIRLCNVIP